MRCAHHQRPQVAVSCLHERDDAQRGQRWSDLRQNQLPIKAKIKVFWKLVHPGLLYGLNGIVGEPVFIDFT